MPNVRVSAAPSIFETAEQCHGTVLQNRALQMVTPGAPASLAGWTAVNNGNITVVAAPVPVSSALPNAIQLTVPPGAVSGVGFANTGYSDGNYSHNIGTT